MRSDSILFEGRLICVADPGLPTAGQNSSKTCLLAIADRLLTKIQRRPRGPACGRPIRIYPDHRINVGMTIGHYRLQRPNDIRRGRLHRHACERVACDIAGVYSQ
jgi:hypothetical protein